jgi:hypothetical protein
MVQTRTKHKDKYRKKSSSQNLYDFAGSNKENEYFVRLMQVLLFRKRNDY